LENPVQNELSRVLLKKVWVEGCVWWYVAYITFNFIHSGKSKCGRIPCCGFNGPCCKQTKKKKMQTRQI